MTFEITKVTNAADGSTVLLSEQVSFSTSAAGIKAAEMKVSRHQDCNLFLFVELPVGYSDKHSFAHRKSILVVLSGELEVKVSDETVAKLVAGDVLRLEDMAFEKPSREMTVVSNEPVRAIVVQLD